MSIRLLFLAIICWPIHALSDTWVPITSEIPGVQLWELYAGEGNSFPYEKFEGDDTDFIQHCNGTRSIYITSFESPVKCQSQRDVETEGFYRIYVNATDKRLSGLVVVSKRPLPPRVRSLPITFDESERLKKAEQAPIAALAKKATIDLMKQYGDGASAASYAEYVREIKAGAIYRKHSGARFKFSSPSGFIYISATGLSLNPMGWEMVNLVFREIDGTLQNIGAFEGCIRGGFRDLNSDGTPEVLTSTCENAESTSDSYWTLTPVVREVATH